MQLRSTNFYRIEYTKSSVLNALFLSTESTLWTNEYVERPFDGRMSNQKCVGLFAWYWNNTQIRNEERISKLELCEFRYFSPFLEIIILTRFLWWWAFLLDSVVLRGSFATNLLVTTQNMMHTAYRSQNTFNSPLLNVSHFKINFDDFQMPKPDTFIHTDKIVGDCFIRAKPTACGRYSFLFWGTSIYRYLWALSVCFDGVFFISSHQI